MFLSAGVSAHNHLEVCSETLDFVSSGIEIVLLKCCLRFNESRVLAVFSGDACFIRDYRIKTLFFIMNLSL